MGVGGREGSAFSFFSFFPSYTVHREAVDIHERLSAYYSGLGMTENGRGLRL